MIELVTAMAILAILLTASMPMLQSVMNSSRSRSAAQRMQEDLQWAEGQAIQGNTDVSFILNGSDCGGSAWEIKNSSGAVLRCMSRTDFSALYRQVSITPTGATPLSINSLGVIGGLNGGALPVNFTAGTSIRTLTVLYSGRCDVS